MILSHASDLNALYCVLVAGGVSEICLCKVWNYNKGVTAKRTFKFYL